MVNGGTKNYAVLYTAVVATRPHGGRTLKERRTAKVVPPPSVWMNEDRTLLSKSMSFHSATEKHD